MFNIRRFGVPQASQTINQNHSEFQLQEQVEMDSKSYLKDIVFKAHKQSKISSSEFLSQICNKIMIEEEQTVNKRVVEWLIMKKNIFDLIFKYMKSDKLLIQVCLEILLNISTLSDSNGKYRVYTDLFLQTKGGKLFEYLIYIISDETSELSTINMVLIILTNFTID